MKQLFKNGKVLNEAGELVLKDVLVEDGMIMAIEENINVDGAEIIDVDGKFVSPGLVDVHVHLREPGGEQKETIETGTMSAAKGGFTTICSMPNTKPVPDNAETMRWLHEKIKETAVVNVLPYASITLGERGEELVNFEGLTKAGAFAFTDDGVGIQSAGQMLEAMKQAAASNMAIVAHCEDNSLINNGCVHEGKFSAEQGINGIPSVCESVQIARDVLLAEAANCHYHVCHISTKESVRVVRDAKKAGIKVTAEVSPHHLLLCEDDIPGLDTNYKMNPPLRGKDDLVALREGLLDGTIDMIATDHAPHTAEDKGRGMAKSAMGIVGLETAFPLLYTNFVKTNQWTLKQLIDWMATIPATTFGLDKGELAVGKEADITIIDLNKEEKINPEYFASKGRNTPFGNWSCQGWPVATYVKGKLAYEAKA